MSRKTYTAPATEAKDFCAYVGPTIIGVIQNGTIYSSPRDVVLQELASVIEKHPNVAKLIVPGAELAEARKNIKTPGNRLYVAYRSMTGKN